MSSAGTYFVHNGGQLLGIGWVEDGKLLKKNLPHARKTAAWVRKTLSRHNTSIKNTYLLTVDREGREQFIRKEEPS